MTTIVVVVVVVVVVAGSCRFRNKVARRSNSLKMVAMLSCTTLYSKVV